mgnify:CR=1 FL=1
MSIFISFSGIARQKYAIKFMNFFNKHGFKTWYDQHELLLGDDLRKTITTAGIEKSKYAIIIINETFLKRKWPCEEARLLYEKFKNKGDITLFPILLDISKDELAASSLSYLLEIKYQFLTSGETIDKIGFQILNRIFADILHSKRISNIDIALNYYKRLTLTNSINIFNSLSLIKNFAENDYKSRCILFICLIGLFSNNPYNKITQNISYMIYKNDFISFDIYKITEAVFLICSGILFEEEII